MTMATMTLGRVFHAIQYQAAAAAFQVHDLAIAVNHTVGIHAGYSAGSAMIRPIKDRTAAAVRSLLDVAQRRTPAGKTQDEAG